MIAITTSSSIKVKPRFRSIVQSPRIASAKIVMLVANTEKQIGYSQFATCFLLSGIAYVGYRSPGKGNLCRVGIATMQLRVA